MIDPAAFTRLAAGAQRRLAADIAGRIAELPELAAFAAAEHRRAQDAERTQLTERAFTEWLADQAATGWVLAATLVRFLEDTGLIAEPIITGPGDRDARARDALTLHFQARPEDSEREYLLARFAELARLPGLGELFGGEHLLLSQLPPSADAVKELIELFRQRDPASGELAHDFTDLDRSTRFLGDLYQDLSAEAKKRYALLQTPDFIERFILERTLEPAIAERGLEATSLIDPACGSGHFLLGAFDRLFRHWRERELHTEPRLLAQRALDQIAGVDLNPIAVAIARFRLLVAALSAGGARTLTEAPDYSIHLAAADSLLHGPRPGQLPNAHGHPARAHHYRAEDAAAAERILGRTYACVVANPPYITPKDPAANAAYRARFGSCHRQYSMAVPFTERLFDLASPSDDPQGAGWVGMITANSFMKREFGTKLIRDYLPQWDLTHVIDTSGAYIPGHGTPTVILLARNRAPREDNVRAALGIRGEPSTPREPAKGLVWSAIVDQIDRPESESEFVSVVDMPRERLMAHPWSLSGGGAAEVKAAIERASSMPIQARVDEIGFGAVTREDDVYRVGLGPLRRAGIKPHQRLPLVAGDELRDWRVDNPQLSLWPYDPHSLQSDGDLAVKRFLWYWRTQLADRVAYGKSQVERGLAWFEYSMFFRQRFRVPRSIAFAFVATHNHFVIDRGGKVFNRSAPVIKLLPDADEDEHLRLLGPLNSSVGCFWMKQSFFNKGSTVDQRGARQRTAPFEDFWEHDSTKLARFPLPLDPPLELARSLDSLGQETAALTPAALCAQEVPTRAGLDAARATWASIRRRMIALQEELDWRCYRLYGLIEEDLTYACEPPEVAFGERAFEIALGRQVAAGELETAWFSRHRAEPLTEVPARFPADYRELIERRLEAIADSRAINLIERPEYKRRWAHEPWETQEQKALGDWLLDRMEEPRFWADPAQPDLQSVARLADRLREDDEFMGVLALYLGQIDFDLTGAVRKLVDEEAVPYLAALRHSPAGMAKRAEWQRVWDLQRAEDAIDARTELGEDHREHLSPEAAKRRKAEEIGTITPPPRYAQKDYARGSYWRHRGKLDVPKERFISYPGAERAADPTPVIGWAGWDHRQRAIALASYLVRAQDTEGFSPERLIPLLAGLAELVPWLLQWHDEPDAQGNRFGQFVKTFLAERMRKAGLGAEAVAGWRPEPPKRGRRARIEG